MRNFKFYLFVFFGAAGFLFAQKSTVTVTVLDERGQNLNYALVELYDAQENLITGAVTAENGVATLSEVPFGEYNLKIEEGGFVDVSKNLKVDKKLVEVGKIQLQLKKELKEVVARADNSVYKTEIDKRVIEVGKDLESAGASAQDVLNNVPSVSVDQQTGEVSLRGNANVKVLVDGKPSNIPTAQLLRQLPSNSIKSIEIITNPSAKYDPEGNSGILNIITYKEKRTGYNANINMGFTQGRKSRENSSIDLNYNTGKFNLFGNYNGNFGQNLFKGSVINESTKIDQSFSILNDEPENLVKFGFDYFINDKTALTVYTNQNFNRGTGLWNYDFFESENTYHNFNNQLSEFHNQDYSLNFKQNFKKEDHFIELDGIFSTSNSTDNREYETVYPLGLPNPQQYLEDRSDKNQNTRINLDYTNLIKKKLKLEAGLQYRREFLDNGFDSSQKVENSSHTEYYNPNISFDYTRQIYSSYVNLNQKFGKVGVQLGLRAEQVNEKSDNLINSFNGYYTSPYKNEYFEVYPSAFFTFETGKTTTLSLNYSRRVDRPSVYQVTPVAQWSSGLLKSIGNQDLQPQFTNSFEMGFLKKIKNGSLSANIFYRKVNDEISRFLSQDPEVSGGVIMQYLNYDSSNSYGIESSLNLKLKEWWNLNFSIDYFSNEIRALDIKKQSTPLNVRINQNFKVSKTISLQNFFMYRSNFIFIQGEMQPMWRMDLGGRWTFLDGKANLSLRFSDLFRTFYARVKIYNPYTSEGSFKWEAQTVYLGFSYNLGGKVKTRADKQKNQNETGGGGIGF